MDGWMDFILLSVLLDETDSVNLAVTPASPWSPLYPLSPLGPVRTNKQFNIDLFRLQCVCCAKKKKKKIDERTRLTWQTCRTNGT